MKTFDKEKLYQNIYERAQQNISDGKLGCAHFLISQNNETILNLTVGDNPLHGAPLKNDATYRLASMTKPVTATAVLQLCEKGLLDLNDEVSKYLPQFKTVNIGHVENGQLIIDCKAENPIRIINLLTHTSGLDCDELCLYLDECHPRKTLKETVEFFSQNPIAFEPGTKESYCQSAAFDVAARIVELLSNEDFDSYCDNHIFKPLEMTDTGFKPNDDQWKRLVYMHSRDKETLKSVNRPQKEGCLYCDYPVSATMAGAGLFSTASDYSRFAQMLLNEGRGENGSIILKPETVEKMRTAWVNEDIMPHYERWGLGVRVVTADDYPFGLIKGCYGWSGAWGTHFWVDPINRVTAICMRNSHYDPLNRGDMTHTFEKDVCDALE